MTDFDDKLRYINKNVTSNKIKHVAAEKKLNNLSKKINYYQQKIIYFSWIECVSQAIMVYKNTFVYQPALCTLQSQKGKSVD